MSKNNGNPQYDLSLFSSFMTTWQTIKKFFEPAFALKTITLKAVVFSSFRTCYNLLSVILIQKIIDYLQTGNVGGIQYWLLVYAIGFIVALVVFNITYSRWRGAQIHQYEKYIQTKYMKLIMLIENTQFEKVGTGKFIGTIKSGSESRADSLTSLSYDVPSFIISITYSLYLAYVLSPWFLLGYICIFILLGAFVVFINRKGLVFRRNIAETKISLSRHIVKMLMSKIETIIGGKVGAELDKLGRLDDELAENNRKLSFYTFFTHEGPRSFLNLTKIILIGLLAYTQLAHGIQLSQIIGFLIIVGYVDNSVQGMAASFKTTTKRLNDIEKLWEFEQYPSIGDSYNNGTEFSYQQGVISFDAISFGYNQSAPLFSNFSLTIQGNKKTALVGPSGGGKSTLIKLIAGYITPDAGDVMIDNQKLSGISLISYYKHIGYLTQEPSVFDGTIRENLMYGISALSSGEEARRDKKKSEEAVIKASKCEWIYELPHGLDTEIGERGVRLSGGQKQRLAIAKIMLKNPDIILLDEPTSALDSYNEEQVTQALNNLFQNKTVIVIAHRLQTVKHADDIIYISDGKVIERGTHQELIDLQGEYYKMVELQSGF